MHRHTRLPRHAFAYLAVAFLSQEATSQTQKLSFVSCSTTSTPVAGFECGKAYDGNNSTEWRVQALPGTGQVIQFNFGTLRRVKRIVVTWSTAPTHDRSYMTIDKTGSWRWVNSINGSQTTDDVTLTWGEDLNSDEDNVVWTSQSVLLEVYSSAVAGIREITAYGPGVYSDDQILTRVIPIPAWKIDAVNSFKSVSISPPLDFSRLVGASVFLYGDDNSVHNLTSLVPFPATTYNYDGGGPMGGGGTHSPSGFTVSDETNTVSIGASSFKDHPNFDDPVKFPRGYITLRYLSQAPEFAP